MVLKLLVAHRIINGLKAQGTEVKDCKVLFYGAGSSAVGVANMIASLLHKEGGLSEKEAKEVHSKSYYNTSCKSKQGFVPQKWLCRPFLCKC